MTPLPLRFLSAADADARYPAAPRIDGGAIADAASLFRALDAALGLPPHFGQNWDALMDVLRDPEELRLVGAGPLVLRVDAAPRLFRDAYPVAAALAELWLQAALERPADAPEMTLVLCG